MKPLVSIGLILVVLGAAALIYLGANGALTHDLLVKAGPVEVQAVRHYAVPPGAIAAIVGIVGGAVLMIFGMSKRGPV